MKWFVTQDMCNISQRLRDIGETVLSTPEMHRDPDDPDMEEAKDYNIRKFVNSLEEEPDVIILGNVNQPPFYSKGFSRLFHKKGGKVLMGGNDNDPTGIFYNSNRRVKCTITTRQLSVYLTNDTSVKSKLNRHTRVFDLSGDVRSLVQAAEDALQRVEFGKLYV